MREDAVAGIAPDSDIPELMIGLGERLLGRRELIDGEQTELEVGEDSDG